MAHFAQIGLDNIVLNVIVVDDKDTSTEGGIEREEIGVKYLSEQTGHQAWVKCSYNTSHNIHRNGKTPLRANYPGIGWYYDSTNDIFYPPRPVDYKGVTINSWILNTTIGDYEPPIPKPTGPTEEERLAVSGDDLMWLWDEDLHQSDNTKGWELVII